MPRGQRLRPAYMAVVALVVACLASCARCGADTDEPPADRPAEGSAEQAVAASDEGLEWEAPSPRTLGPVAGLAGPRASVESRCRAESRDVVWDARYVDGLLVELTVNPRAGTDKERHWLRWSAQQRIMGWEHTTARGEPEQVTRTVTYRYDSNGWLSRWGQDGVFVECRKDGRDDFACEGEGWQARVRERQDGWPVSARVSAEGTAPVTYEFSYGEIGLEKLEQKAGDVQRTIRYGYDEAGRLSERESSLTFPQAADASSSTVRLTRDAAGNVAQATSRCEGSACPEAERVVTMTYDDGFEDTFCGAAWLPGVPGFDAYHGLVIDL